MSLWTFYDFHDVRGINLIRRWLDSIPERAAAKINTRILFMRAIPLWPEQYTSALVGYPELFELRVVCDGNQYRPLAFYGPPGSERQVTLVLGTVEKGKLPRRILEVADENRKIVLSDRRRIREHEFDKTPGA
jgi:hypothetical protein